MTDRYTLHTGDCRDVMRDYPADHFDSIVSDPPYGLSFMGKEWDKGVPGDQFWREAFRVAKPGAHLLAFGGTRTFHRLTCAIEDAGWEIRDCVMWVYGTGFPKSHNIGNAIDKAAGAERVILGKSPNWRPAKTKGGARFDKDVGEGSVEINISAPATDAAKQWEGWGSALKPAWEPIIVARKPLVGTVANNVLAHGTGAINIDGCRIGSEIIKIFGTATMLGATPILQLSADYDGKTHQGRWPANLMHDGSDEVLAGFSEDNIGSAARFFYCAKTSRRDREEGCDHLPARSGADAVDFDEGAAGLKSPRAGASRTADTVRNFHPTVKPTDLMRYLVRLVTPPGGTVLDPFMGSGSTGKAALLEGFRFVGIDLDQDHVAIAQARCQFAVDTIDAEPAAAAAPGVQLELF